VVSCRPADIRVLRLRHILEICHLLPELFPTHIRSTAVGFCTGSARVVTSFGPLVAGLMAGLFGGSFNKVTAVMTCFAALSIVAMMLGPETRDTGLPR
jgi:hypothetical protein